MTLLSATIREEITKRVLDHWFGPRIKEIQRRKTELLEEFYNSIYTTEVLEIISKLPSHLKLTGKDFSLTVDGCNYYICSDVELTYLNTYYLGRYSTREDSESKRCVRLVNAGSDESDLHDARRTRQHEIKAVMKNVRTIEALIKKWPEIEEFCTGFSSVTNLPAVQIVTLNKFLGLPPDKESEAA